jgi:hypothetical protein
LKGRGFLLWPSPIASNAFQITFSIAALLNAPHMKGGKRNGTEYLPEAVAKEFGGYVHPQFSEWLIGLPRDWTLIDCTRLETQPAPRSLNGSGGD